MSAPLELTLEKLRKISRMADRVLSTKDLEQKTEMLNRIDSLEIDTQLHSLKNQLTAQIELAKVEFTDSLKGLCAKYGLELSGAYPEYSIKKGENAVAVKVISLGKKAIISNTELLNSQPDKIASTAATLLGKNLKLRVDAEAFHIVFKHCYRALSEISPNHTTVKIVDVVRLVKTVYSIRDPSVDVMSSLQRAIDVGALNATLSLGASPRDFVPLKGKDGETRNYVWIKFESNDN